MPNNAPHTCGVPSSALVRARRGTQRPGARPDAAVEAVDGAQRLLLVPRRRGRKRALWGLGPGLMATTLSALASNYFFLRPYGELLSGPEGALRVAIFLATGVMVSWLADGRKRAEEHLRERNEDLERVVAQRKALEERLVYRATHDYLTDLHNQASFYDHLSHALSRARRWGSKVAVMFVDLDDFKLVNDSLGHQEGDRVLRAVAERLRESLRGSDLAARIGGGGRVRRPAGGRDGCEQGTQGRRTLPGKAARALRSRRGGAYDVHLGEHRHRRRSRGGTPRVAQGGGRGELPGQEDGQGTQRDIRSRRHERWHPLGRKPAVQPLCMQSLAAVSRRRRFWFWVGYFPRPLHPKF